MQRAVASPAATLALLCGALLLVGGCGAGSAKAGASSDPSSAASPSTTFQPLPSASPARGVALRGNGYVVHLPPGWRDVTKALRSRGPVDRAAGDAVPVHGFASNLNIVVTRSGLRPTQLPGVVAMIRRKLAPTAPTYRTLARTEVAGAPAGHLAGLRSKVSQPYWLEQYVVARPAHSYVISFSFSPHVTAAQRQHTIGAVLASWHWR